MDTAQLMVDMKEALMGHGVVISHDDPILMLVTATQLLVDKQQGAQQEMLREFREEMESFALQFSDDQRRRAERILNAALEAAKASISDIISNTCQAPQPAPPNSANGISIGLAMTLALSGGVGVGIVFAIALGSSLFR